MKSIWNLAVYIPLWLTLGMSSVGVNWAQNPPSEDQIENYRGLHQAAYQGDVRAIQNLVAGGANLEQRDQAGQTPLHIATFASRDQAVRALAMAGADLNALEHQAYDMITIAAVANDIELVSIGLSLGANAGNVTSPYDGTALIAASHLGHFKVVGELIAAGAPLDHVNNLGWTALIEAVILGDGGPNHIATVRALVEAGANRTIGDRQGTTPLDHARSRGYPEIIELLRQ